MNSLSPYVNVGSLEAAVCTRLYFAFDANGMEVVLVPL